MSRQHVARPGRGTTRRCGWRRRRRAAAPPAAASEVATTTTDAGPSPRARGRPRGTRGPHGHARRPGRATTTSAAVPRGDHRQQASTCRRRSRRRCRCAGRGRRASACRAPGRRAAAAGVDALALERPACVRSRPRRAAAGRARGPPSIGRPRPSSTRPSRSWPTGTADACAEWRRRASPTRDARVSVPSGMQARRRGRRPRRPRPARRPPGRPSTDQRRRRRRRAPRPGRQADHGGAPSRRRPGGRPARRGCSRVVTSGSCRVSSARRCSSGDAGDARVDAPRHRCSAIASPRPSRVVGDHGHRTAGDRLEVDAHVGDASRGPRGCRSHDRAVRCAGPRAAARRTARERRDAVGPSSRPSSASASS